MTRRPVERPACSPGLPRRSAFKAPRFATPGYAATVLLAIAAAGGSRLAGQVTVGRASHAFSVVADETPRFLPVDRESHIVITLRNEGTETWDPRQQFYVSYRWVTAGITAPGTVLDMEGVRTELPRAVAPGESVTTLARVSPPPNAGLYRLRWDMVQEGVTWFSDRDPMTPRSALLMVLPRGRAVLRPIPAVLTLLLLWMPRRQPAQRAALMAGPAIWCAVSLLIKQWMLVAETGIAPAPGALWLTTLLAVVPVLVVALATDGVLGPWLLGALGSLVLFADVLYFRYFGDVISAPVLLASGQTGNVFDSIVTLIKARDLWFAIDLAAAVPFLWRRRMVHRRVHAPWGRATRLAAAAICALAATIAGVRLFSASPQDSSALDQVFTNTAVVQRLGPFGYHVQDTWSYLRSSWLRPPLSATERDEVRDWFARREPLRAGAGPFFGIARQRNLLVIQVESLQGFIVGLRINGQEVTPNLNRWWTEGLAFSAVTDQTSEGRTSDAELTALASLLPLEHGAAAFRYPGNHFVSLPQVLGAHGYTTLSAVPFAGSFWNRRAVYPAYGFSRSLFDDAFAPGEVIGWGLNDRDFLLQMVPKLARLPRPFLAWLVTLSLHHPFASFPDGHKVMNVGEWTNKPFGNYLHTMRFFDTALGELRNALAREGLADDTVIVIFGDHDAGFAWESPIARTVGFPASVIDWNLADRVPWLVLVPGANAPRRELTMRAGQIDMAPTLLALMGIDPAPLPFMGRNLLGKPAIDTRVRPHGSWVNDRLLFDAEAKLERRCYDVATRNSLPVEHCEQGAMEGAQAREISRRVLAYDLQATLVK